MNDLLHDNRVILKDVIRAQAAALAEVHELSFKLLKGSFNRGQFKMVLQFGVPAIEAEMHQEWLTAIIPILGFPDTIIGTAYTIDGRTFTVVDINPKLNHKCMRVTEVGSEDTILCTTPSRIRGALGLPDPHAEGEDMDVED